MEDIVTKQESRSDTEAESLPRVGSGPGVWVYPAAGLLSILITIGLLQLQYADLRVPFIYRGDALFYSMMIKGIIDNGWYLHNEFIGMPWPADLHDFPVPDNFHFFLIKLATIFIPHQGLILNLFFLVTFPFTTLTALYVFRQFKISALPALLGALLYTFTTFHLSRNVAHLMHSAYYVVPLIVLVILWTCAEQVSGKRRVIFSLVVCAMIASTGGVYYSFFACYLLLLVGFFLVIRRRRIRSALVPLLLAGAIFATLIVNLSPSILYRLTHGMTGTAQRQPAEAEIFGLKIAQLLLPVTGHRVPALARLKSRYNANPLVNENDDATLGIIGSLGFLFLLGWLLAKVMAVRMHADEPDHVLSHLSFLNIAAVLLGTIGGFGAIFNLLVSPQVRGYNRVSIYVSFFSLFAVALLLDHVARAALKMMRWRIALGVALGLLTFAGLLDQTSQRFVPDYAMVRAEYRSDADFVKQLEASVPPGTMIFQLPFHPFPENGPTGRMGDYDPFKGYLHSRKLRWSYGAMRGRASDLWQRQVVATATDDVVETLALAGFGGIYLDRFGYADNGAKMEAALAGLLGATAIESANGRLAFFDLAAYQQGLKEKSSGTEMETKRGVVVQSLLLSWKGGFFGLEGKPDESWRWCVETGELQFENRSSRRRRVTMEGTFAASKEANLTLAGDLASAQLKIGPVPRPLVLTFDVPPGIHSIKFASDAPRVAAPNDRRVLVFRIFNFNLKAAD